MKPPHSYKKNRLVSGLLAAYLCCLTAGGIAVVKWEYTRLPSPVRVVLATSEPPNPDFFPISLATATETSLLRVPGIGSVLAGRILALREERGGFESLEELLDVQGIGEKNLEAIRPYLVP